jgi:steroid 5-alpha reductase family enzyme
MTSFMDSFIGITLLNLSAVIAMMFLGWLVSLRTKNVTVVDSLWGLGFVIIAWITYFMSDGYATRKFLLTLLVTVWGLRLSLYLSWRNWGKGEDPRYGSWRKESGERFWIVSLFKVFVLQAVVMWCISLAPQVGQLAAVPARLTWLDALGSLTFTVGFLFESVSDWQLLRFKSKPENKGRVMDRGLWSYSRHPNYFGEFLVWWGIFLVALATPGSWWTVVSPLIVTAVLTKMTGIPLTEKTITHTRPGYAAYADRTNAFFPWFPEKRER